MTFFLTPAVDHHSATPLVFILRKTLLHTVWTETSVDYQKSENALKDT